MVPPDDGIVGVYNSVFTYIKGSEGIERYLGWSVERVAVGNGVFMAAGLEWGEFFPTPQNSWISLDGRIWVQNSQALNGLYVSDLLFVQPYFYILGSEYPYWRIYRSKGSGDWIKVFEREIHPGGVDPQTLRIKYANNQLTAVISDAVLTSTNGSDWTASPNESWWDLRAVVRLPSGYLIAGTRGLFITPDIQNWNINDALRLHDGRFTDVEFACGTALALRENGEIYRSNLHSHLSAKIEDADLVLQVFGQAPAQYVVEQKAALNDRNWTKVDEFSDLRERSQTRIENFRSKSTSFLRLRRN